jgi:hypothetical protein
MPLYFSAHTTACLTKQAIRDLMKELMKPSEVRIGRCVAGQIAARLLVELEAPDQATVEKFFASRFVNIDWVMRIDLEGREGEVNEY